MAASIYASKSGIASDPGSIRPGTVSAAVKQPAVAAAIYASQSEVATDTGTMGPRNSHNSCSLLSSSKLWAMSICLLIQGSNFLRRVYASASNFMIEWFFVLLSQSGRRSRFTCCQCVNVLLL